MKIWFDTEFIEDGRTIDLLSIGMVAEDGRQLYAENENCLTHLASPWVKENVFPHLSDSTKHGHSWHKKHEIAQSVIDFVGAETPQFWAYYADYDWVVLCQLYGTMMNLPNGWPMFCMDIKQLCVSKGDPDLPKQEGVTHNALADAVWAKQAFDFLVNQ